MAKLGITKNLDARIGNKVKNHPDLVDNKWLKDGHSKAFRINDPATKLITMIGAGFFNEPRYYDESKGSTFELSDQAQEIIDTAVSVAESDNPMDLWVICRWAREELHARTTPNVLAAIGANKEGTKSWAREYIPKIAQRADEPIQVFYAYETLFGKPYPNCLKRGLADAISKYDEWQILRYFSNNKGSLKHVLCNIERRNNWPISKELREYIFTGELVDPEKTPILAARKCLAQQKEFDAKSKELILKGRIPWEVVVSQFGSTHEVWEFLVQENLLGYMALLRNLRNLEEASISDSAKRKVKEKLVGGVANSKQYPFRFLAARKNTSTNWAASAIDLALNESVNNIPDVPGKTAILIDVSYSMNSPISLKSAMTCADVSRSLGAVLAKKCGAENVAIYAFAERFQRVQYSDADSVMNIIDRVGRADVGQATYAYLPLQDMTSKRDRFDRIIILSDMQCYTAQPDWWRNGGGAKLQEEILKYKSRVNRDIFIHSVDLQGYGDSQVIPDDKNVQLVGGWSENIFNLIRTFEGIDAGVQIPTIEELRKRY